MERILNRHLDVISTLLSESSELTRKLSFHLKPKKPTTHLQTRTAAIYRERSDYNKRESVLKEAQKSPSAFWNLELVETAPTNGSRTPLLQDFVYSTLDLFLRIDKPAIHQILLRRLSGVIVYLLSKTFTDRYDIQSIARSFHNAGLHLDLSGDALKESIRQFCNAGRRYLDIALELGGIGALLCLPTDVPRTV